MLEVIVGMLFTFMMLSLLGTTLNELISSWRGWRGYYLEEGLKRLLEYESDKSIFEKFKNNVLYRQLNQHKVLLRVSTAPAYLSSSNFVSILTQVLKEKGKVVQKAEDLINNLPEGNSLRELLEQIKEEGDDAIESYKLRLQAWFDDIMTQASGWYKRHLQFVTLFVGLSIAVVFNADSFQIYSHLATNAAARQRINLLAEQFVAVRQSVPGLVVPSDTLTLKDIKSELKQYINSEEFAQTSNILGLGWHWQDLYVSPMVWLRRLLGWFITALAISLGAPFWFDVLKKIITIRSSGAPASSPAQVVIQTDQEKKK